MGSEMCIRDRYNYWIVIILMMTGLYTVIARGNLVKKVIGLNVFQTSVFIFYITIGKITGGTAPIYTADDWNARTDHGDGHGDAHGGDHNEGHGGENAHDGVDAHGAESLHDASHGANQLSGYARDLTGNHDHKNELTEEASLSEGHGVEAPANDHLHQETALIQSSDHGEAVSGHAVEASSVLDVVYSNPLPHVLILTAIVVGVATTAVGLALAVRIREAYGTIEEDELEALDNIAEFGEAMPLAGEAS